MKVIHEDNLLPRFYDWLRLQVGRTDRVGVFARFVVKDKIFPRNTQRLHIFLLRFEHMPEHREMLKEAHAEFRAMKKTARDAQSSTHGDPSFPL